MKFESKYNNYYSSDVHNKWQPFSSNLSVFFKALYTEGCLYTVVHCNHTLCGVFKFSLIYKLSSLQERHAAKTVGEIKQFVSKLPHMQAAKASLATREYGELSYS